MHLSATRYRTRFIKNWTKSVIVSDQGIETSVVRYQWVGAESHATSDYFVDIFVVCDDDIDDSDAAKYANNLFFVCFRQ